MTRTYFENRDMRDLRKMLATFAPFMAFISGQAMEWGATTDALVLLAVSLGCAWVTWR